jgi:hypothetical protein
MGHNLTPGFSVVQFPHYPQQVQKGDTCSRTA